MKVGGENCIAFHNMVYELDNKIGEEGARIVSELLKTNSTLTKLDLRSDATNK